MIKKAVMIAAGLTAAFSLASGPAFAAGDAAAGAKIFKKKCKACHSVQEGKNKVGPFLYGVYGRKAGTAKGYTRYKGLKGADFVWDEKLLDEWLTNPSAFAKEHTKNKKSSMTYKLKKENQRADVIEYLKTVK